MKNYLLYFLCFFLCVLLTPAVYSLMPESLKSVEVDAFAENSSGITSDGVDTVKLLDAATESVWEIPIEEYVAGVLYAEIPSDAPSEMLKTMAVVIRTYAVYHVIHGDKNHLNADLCNDTAHCRNYAPGVTDEAILKAVSDTEGEIINYNGQVIDPIVHISSSVRTESAEYVFDTAVPYLISVETPDESAMSGFYGKKEFSKNEFASILTSYGYTIDQSTNHLSWISYISYTVGGRVKTAYICGYEISGIKLMKMLSLQSANITVSTGDNGFVFTTEGIGHGVGLSEYGAWVMAEDGKTYKEIIIHYYNGVYISFN